ncbi:MAG: hypothetical protein ACLFN8_03195 [Candidatus Woesearchaeota archaeon]
MKKNIFFLTITIILLIQITSTLAEVDCLPIEHTNGKIYTNCYELKPNQYNTTNPEINATYKEHVDIVKYDLRRLGDLDFNMSALEIEDYFELNPVNYDKYVMSTQNQRLFESLGILSDGKYLFLIEAFNKPRTYMNTRVFFDINASQMNFWVKYPAYHNIQKPDFAASPTLINNLTIQTERPVEGCRYGSQKGHETAQELYDFFDGNNFELKENNILQITNFNFNQGVLLNSTHNFRALEVICKEEQQGDSPAKYSYKRIRYVAQTTPPQIISIQSIPEVVRSMSQAQSIINITTDQTSICTLELPQLPNNIAGANPDFKFTKNYLFNDLTYYQKNKENEIKFRANPSPYEFLFNVTCTNLANRSTNTIQKINTDFDLDTSFVFIEPKNLINTKTINVSGAYRLDGDFSCFASFNNETTQSNLNFKGLIQTGTNAGKYLFEAQITKTNLQEGTNEIHVTCTGRPPEIISTKQFKIDTIEPKNIEIETNANTCTLSQISATFKAEDENGIDYFEYIVEYKGTKEIEFKQEGETTKKITITIPTNLRQELENETIEIKARAFDPAGNPSAWGTRQIKVTSPNMVECDFKPPKITIRDEYDEIMKNWQIQIICKDDETDCKTSFLWNHITNTSNECTPTQTATLTQNLTIMEKGRFCATVYDLNNNNATKTKLLTRDNYGEECEGICGGDCAPCELNETCEENSDCESNYCNEGICAVASCEDELQNGLETGLDCGGPHCEPCNIGEMCISNADCESLNCENGTCIEASCTNNQIDGYETDIDCGGPDCEPCIIGDMCDINSDCTEGECIFGRCTDPDANKTTTTPTDPDDELPDFDSINEKSKPKLIGIILLILGVLSVIAGGVLIYLEAEKKKKRKQQEELQKTKAAINAGMPKVTTLQNKNDDANYKTKQLSPQEIEARKRAWKESLKEKDADRKNILNSFEEEPNQEQKTEEEQKNKEPDSSTTKKDETKTKDTQIKKDEQTEKNKKEDTQKEYVDIDELKKDDAFEQLKQKTNKKTISPNKTKAIKRTLKPKTNKKIQKDNDDDFFEKLKEMNKKNKKTKK